MTIDEVIKHAEEIANENQRVVDTHILFDDVSIDMFYCDDTEVIDEQLADYQRNAEEYRLIAEWLKELKEIKETMAQLQYDTTGKNPSWKRYEMLNKIKNILARNACNDCYYYSPSTKVCQSKKIQTCGCHSYVNWFDRKFCKTYKNGK